MSLRNILHSFIVQEQKSGGLEYFSSYSRSSMRRAKKDYELADTFKSILDNNYTFYIEGRIIFHNSEEEIAFEISKWFKSFLETNLIIKNHNNKLKFMLHYKKKKEQELIDTILPIRYKYFYQNIFKKSQVLLNFLQNKKYKEYKISIDIKKIHDLTLIKIQDSNPNLIRDINIEEKNITLNLHNLISGIDAASLEYNTPPEVFAPVYNYIKHSPELLNKSFQFSFHAGEDTEDIMTSLRTIVESIFFLDLKKGDRLGHALSLGFLYENSSLEEDIFLTSKEKALDNAVFLYFIFYSLYEKEDRYKYLNIFEQKIFKLGAEIYIKNYTPEQYINAWLLRRNSPLTINRILNEKYHNSYIKKFEELALFLKSLDITAYHKYKHLYHYKLFFKYSIQDVFKLRHKINNFYTQRYESARNDIDAWSLYLQYHFSRRVRIKGNEQIEESFYSPKIIQIAQDLIMEHIIAKNDIIIEVMPTSNILNSQISSYSKHPLFRFKPVDGDLTPYNHYNIRTTSLKIIINTDNPGFQATSYLNELFLVNEAAIKLGYHHKDIESYINEIVELGNMIFIGKAPQE